MRTGCEGVDSGEVQGEVEFSASNVELKGRGTQEAIKLGICWWGATADVRLPFVPCRFYECRVCV